MYPIFYGFIITQKPMIVYNKIKKLIISDNLKKQVD